MKKREDKEMLTASQDGTVSLQMNVLVELQPDGSYLAHCLELDLVAEGVTSDAACEELLNVLDVQVRTCFENDNLENLYFPAPPEVWQRLGRAKELCRSQKRHRTIPTPGRRSEAVQLDQYCYV